MSATISTEEEHNYLETDKQNKSNFKAQRNVDYEERHYNITFQVCCTKILLYNM